MVLYLSGGNDALSMLIPYNDPFYYSRRPTIAVPAGNVLQIGTDSSRVALGLHPRLTGLKQIFDQGRLALIQRTGYENQSRSHFLGTDIWSTADPSNSTGARLGRPLSRFAAVAGRSAGRLEHHARSAARAAVGSTWRCRRFPIPRSYAFASPNAGAEAAAERNAAVRINSHVPVDRPELAFVYGSAQAALATLDRVATVATYSGTVTYPNNGLRPGAQGGRRRDGARHRHEGVLRDDRRLRHPFGAEPERGQRHLLQPDGDAERRAAAFYNDLRNQGLLEDTLRA